ncbi:MAG TPA: hypothetical protein VEV13_03315 [Candidatus Limnocylindria bacterium]|nr:hypothetical protein [Candidatus Limnocylindria bacterium]
MKLALRLGAVLAATALAVGTGVVATPASAAPAPMKVEIKGGVTSVVTAPGVAAVLLKGGILPLPAKGTSFGLAYNKGLAVRYGFPIVDPASVLVSPDANGVLRLKGADIAHSGGITFVNAKNGKKVTISNFRVLIDADGARINAYVSALKARADILELVPTSDVVDVNGNRATVSGVKVILPAEVSGILNSVLHTSTFPASSDLFFGTATVRAII